MSKFFGGNRQGKYLNTGKAPAPEQENLSDRQPNPSPQEEPEAQGGRRRPRRRVKLPSREQLLAQLCSVLNGNIRGLACALNAIAEQKAGPAEEAAAE